MKKLNKSPLAFALMIIIVLALVAAALWLLPKKPAGNLTDFAQCLKAKGAVFYGASWCSHCQKTKALFGEAAEYLPYVECSTPDGKSQTDICVQKGIRGYPTWIFADGSQLTGEVSLSALAGKTGCILKP